MPKAGLVTGALPELGRRHRAPPRWSSSSGGPSTAPGLGLLNLGRRYDRQRLEKACERALAIRSASYQSVASILKQGLDRLPPGDDAAAQEELPLHGNVRGAGYYH